MMFDFGSFNPSDRLADFLSLQLCASCAAGQESGSHHSTHINGFIRRKNSTQTRGAKADKLILHEETLKFGNT